MNPNHIADALNKSGFNKKALNSWAFKPKADLDQSFLYIL